MDSHDHSPHLVNRDLAHTCTGRWVTSGYQGLFESGCDDQRDHGSGELPKTLHGEDSVHHGTSPLRACELRSDDRGQGVIATNSNPLILISCRFRDRRYPYLLTMRTRQKMMSPTIETACEDEERACARVENMIMINSSPYIRLRPTTSAR